MLFGQILEFVVVEVAAEADGGQHEDLPVVHSLAASFGIGGPVDIPGDRLENPISQFGQAVDVLQGFENGNEFVAAVEIQSHVEDRSAVESRLAIEGFLRWRQFDGHSECLGFAGEATSSVGSKYRCLFSSVPVWYHHRPIQGTSRPRTRQRSMAASYMGSLLTAAQSSS